MDLLWSSRWHRPRATDVAVDAAGNAYVTIYHREDCTLGSTTINGQEVSIAKLDLAGSFVWARKLLYNSSRTRMAMAPNGNLVVSGGDFGGATADFGPGIVHTCDDSNCAYIAELTPDGKAIRVASARRGGHGLDVAVDNNGIPVHVGYFVAGKATFDDTVFAPDSLPSQQSENMFIWKRNLAVQ